MKTRNPRRNPSMLVTSLVTGGVALASIVLVSVAMQHRRDQALKVCGRIGTLLEAI